MVDLVADKTLLMVPMVDLAGAVLQLPVQEEQETLHQHHHHKELAAGPGGRDQIALQVEEVEHLLPEDLDQVVDQVVEKEVQELQTLLLEHQ